MDRCLRLEPLRRRPPRDLDRLLGDCDPWSWSLVCLLALGMGYTNPRAKVTDPKLSVAPLANGTEGVARWLLDPSVAPFTPRMSGLATGTAPLKAWRGCSDATSQRHHVEGRSCLMIQPPLLHWDLQGVKVWMPSLPPTRLLTPLRQNRSAESQASTQPKSFWIWIQPWAKSGIKVG